MINLFDNTLSVSVEELVELWNTTIERFPFVNPQIRSLQKYSRIRDITPSRRRKINARIKQYMRQLPTIIEWKEVFETICLNKFCLGYDKEKSQYPTWIASFDFIFQHENTIARIIEGHFPRDYIPPKRSARLPTTRVGEKAISAEEARIRMDIIQESMKGKKT